MSKPTKRKSRKRATPKTTPKPRQTLVHRGKIVYDGPELESYQWAGSIIAMITGEPLPKYVAKQNRVRRNQS